MKKIKIVGVGSGGNNAVNHMLESNIKGVDFIAVDGDILRTGTNFRKS